MSFTIMVLSYTFYSTTVLFNADVSSSGNECSHCARSVKLVSASEPFLRRQGETPSVLPGGTVQVIHPGRISSVLVQLSCT